MRFAHQCDGILLDPFIQLTFCVILFAETKPRFICEYSCVNLFPGFELYFVILFHSRCFIIGNRWFWNNCSWLQLNNCWFNVHVYFTICITHCSFGFCNLLHVICIRFVTHYFLQVVKTCNKLFTLMKFKAPSFL